MSLVKRSPEYAHHMDELMREDTRDYDAEYREYQYLQSKKQQGETARKTKEDEDKRSR